ncbi:cache domain-containing protein [uncultured Desulfuromonas sp.]|uniref:cache domain-containing protein n=1 Tax=uncultured Desulfuromonas sp. TaxID=181013 RepID=UPI002AAA6B10|nr:cache domain-containing protein [uncultured Desulfuromonas sp.]
MFDWLNRLFNTLRSRILALTISMVLLSAFTISIMTHYTIDRAVSKKLDQHAKDLIQTVLLNVESEYRSYQFHKQATLERRRQEMKNIVGLALSYVEEQYSDSRAKLISPYQAQQNAIEHIRLLRYDQGVGYLWINSMDQPVPEMIMHPMLPHLDGKALDSPSFNSLAGEKGNFFSKVVSICAEKKEGFVRYLWPKPTAQGLTVQQPKISFVRLFEPWQWVVGTGVYIDDIEHEAERRLASIIEELRAALSQMKVAETGYMCIFNGKKEMLIHPHINGDAFRTMVNPSTGNMLVDDLIVAAKHPEMPLEYLWDRPDHIGKYNYKKRAYIRYFEPLDWYIVSTMYVTELNAPAATAQSGILFMTLGVLLVSSLLALHLSKALSTPLYRLTQRAALIEKDIYQDIDIPVSGTRETQDLAMVLSQMLTSVQVAQSDLKQVNKELEAFAYTVSHDLRTFLTPIVGYAQFLIENYHRVLDEQALDALDEIEQQGDKMLVFMEDLLDLAKVGHDDRPLHPVNTNAVVTDVIMDLNSELVVQQGRIVIEDIPDVYLPKTVVSQLFSNLLTNAIRYSLPDGEQIEVGGYSRGSLIQFYVRDHGPGIDEQEQPQVFEVFFRGKQAKKCPGTGIGLATVQKIARHYGGRAWVNTTEGGGATVWVEVINLPQVNGPTL